MICLSFCVSILTPYQNTYKPSSVDLQLSGSDADLSLETLTEIVCPACPSCSGGIYLIYDDETTSSISIDASDAAIESTLLQLDTLGTASVYGNLTWLNVTTKTRADNGGIGSGSLCHPTEDVSTSIRLRCPYGNLPSFTVINSIRDNSEGYGGTLVSLNISDGHGTKENDYCSNHGVCNFDTGTCLCDRNTTQFPDEWYWWESSDGYGGPGLRGDCGFQRIESTTNVSQGCPVGVVFTDELTPTYETMDRVSERKEAHGDRGEKRYRRRGRHRK